MDHLEIDNKGIVEGIRGGIAISPYCDVLINDIKDLMQEVGCGGAKHIPWIVTRWLIT